MGHYRVNVAHLFSLPSAPLIYTDKILVFYSRHYEAAFTDNRFGAAAEPLYYIINAEGFLWVIQEHKQCSRLKMTMPCERDVAFHFLYHTLNKKQIWPVAFERLHHVLWQLWYRTPSACSTAPPTGNVELHLKSKPASNTNSVCATTLPLEIHKIMY